MKKKFIAVAAAAALLLCGAFVGCGGSATVEYTLSDDGTYYVVSGVSGNKTSLYSYEIPPSYTADGVTLPVCEIAEGAFYGCYYLNRVTIPDSVTKIGNYAFAKCVLSTIDIPDSVTEIGYSAFAYCTALKSVVIPASVKALGDRAFSDCKSLMRAEVYATITDLQYRTFYNTVIETENDIYYSTALTEVVLSAGIEKIDSSAFYGNSITDIYYMGTEEQWSAVYFYTWEEGDDGNAVEKKLTNDEIGRSDNDLTIGTAKVHCNYVPEN